MRIVAAADPAQLAAEEERPPRVPTDDAVVPERRRLEGRSRYFPVIREDPAVGREFQLPLIRRIPIARRIVRSRQNDVRPAIADEIALSARTESEEAVE